jgi:hypothetical protein
MNKHALLLLKHLASSELNTDIIVELPDGTNLEVVGVEATPSGNIRLVTKDEWTPLVDFPDFFSNIRIELSHLNILTKQGIETVSGCVGYACRQVVRGEQLSDPEIIENKHGVTILEYYYDTTKTASDDPDFLELDRLIRLYIMEGTPIRNTNKAGAGTKGTRLVDGIGPVIKEIKIFVQ